MALRRTFYPAKTFDDELDALARLCQAKGWDFPGVGLEQILADAEAQRTERAAHDALVSQAAALHETFGVEQAARFQRFLAVLTAARGAFRSDKSALAELERFHRNKSRRRAAEPEAA
jgi:uncharacterized protein (DUF2384 family)